LTNYESNNPNSWFYEPNPSPYDTNESKSPEGITSWGFTGLQLLTLAGAITLDEALRYYYKVTFKAFNLNDPLNEQIINKFDSQTNAFYNLYYLSLLMGSDYNELTPVESNPIIEGADLNNTNILNSANTFTNMPVSLSRCPSDSLVEVPRIFIYAEPIEPYKLDVAMVTFIVNDIIDYSKPKKICSDKCTGKIPKNQVITTTFVLVQPECNFNSVLATEGSTLLEKCRNLEAIAPYIIQYTYTRSFAPKFFRDLERSRFFRFIEYFTSPSLIDYNGLLYNVIGYGTEKQEGKYYFVKC
jgi:hypothetical protein